MDKRKRQEKILGLIRARRIGTQQELTRRLGLAGVAATQSSVSRDLVELGVVKSRGYYELPQGGAGAASKGLLSLDAAGDAIVVAKCEPGLASAVAVEIDRAHFPEVVGTLAGEDTVFVAVAGQKAQRAAVRKIWELFA